MRHFHTAVIFRLFVGNFARPLAPFIACDVIIKNGVHAVTEQDELASDRENFSGKFQNILQHPTFDVPRFGFHPRKFSADPIENLQAQRKPANDVELAPHRHLLVALPALDHRRHSGPRVTDVVVHLHRVQHSLFLTSALPPARHHSSLERAAAGVEPRFSHSRHFAPLATFSVEAEAGRSLFVLEEAADDVNAVDQ